MSLPDPAVPHADFDPDRLRALARVGMTSQRTAGWMKRLAQIRPRADRIGGYIPAAKMRLVANGEERAIYALDGVPELYVKIVHRKWVDEPIRYLCEYRAQANVSWPDAPIPRLFGVIDTELGPGHLCEAILDPQGNPAPQLRDIVTEDGLPEPILEDFNRYVRVFFDDHIAAFDFNMGNTVYGVAALRPGPARFFMVDGYGDRRGRPAQELFKSYNARRMPAHIIKVHRRTALNWDPATRSFSNPR